jgi:hypothetical protein
MMIPLRRALIVDQHEELKYPEGTACAEVLKAGASKESIEAHRAGGGEDVTESTMGATTIFAGFGIGLVYKAAMEAFKAWKDTPEKIFGGRSPARRARRFHRAPRRRLHHRAAHRVDHMRGRHARASRAHPMIGLRERAGGPRPV